MVTISVDPVNDTVGLAHLKRRYEKSPPAALFDFMRYGIFNQNLIKVCLSRPDEQVGVVLSDKERVNTSYFGTLDEMIPIFRSISLFARLFADYSHRVPKLLVLEVEGMFGGPVRIPEFMSKLQLLKPTTPKDLRIVCLLALGDCDEADIVAGYSIKRSNGSIVSDEQFVEVLTGKYDMCDASIADLLEIVVS